MTILYYSHPDFLAHDTGPGHPECADRLIAIDRALSMPEFEILVRATPPLTDNLRDKIAAVHTPSLIANILDNQPAQGRRLLDSDTVVSPGSAQAALRAVGAVCDAVDQICSGEAQRAFCAVRPPGHHAEAGRAMGFCLFNNVAVAAEYARTHHGLDKIAIVDFDVHHGNGTQAIFYRQKHVLYASSHQMPLYPGTGSPDETGVGNIVNVPLRAGTEGDEFRDKYSRIILPALRQFKPRLLFLSAGFDAHKDEPLASIRLVEADYRWLTEQLSAAAYECCEGRIISVLEGGYNLSALANSVAAHVRALIG
ncbi:MAG: histone deacetylase family protein [Gammaproteobacteria bacterium]